jgi:hypothetical protein
MHKFKLTISQEVLTISTVSFQCTSPKTLSYFINAMYACMHACIDFVSYLLLPIDAGESEVYLNIVENMVLE